MSDPTPILTLGHSNRTWDEFEAVLRAHEVRTVVDVRSHPHSRRHPWFSERALLRALEERGYRYVGLGRALGGHRTVVRRESPHIGLPAGSERAYAEHMSSAPFLLAIEELMELGPGAALLCAERLPQNCHRSLIAEHLTRVRAVPVVHLIEEHHAHPHTPYPAARMDAELGLVFDQGPQRGDQLGLF